MKRTGKKLISKHSERIEKDIEDIEREETDGELVTDVLNDFKRELRRGLRDAVHNCLSDSQKSLIFQRRISRSNDSRGISGLAAQRLHIVFNIHRVLSGTVTAI